MTYWEDFLIIMGRIAFLDLREKELSIYIFDKGNQTGIAIDTIRIPAGDAYSFKIDKIPPDIEESYLSLPVSLLNFRVIELPFTDMTKIRETIPFEIDQLILGGADKVVFDIYILEKNSAKSRVLVSYVMKDSLRKILEKLRISGFDPKVITSVELADIISRSPSKDMAELILTPVQISDDMRREMSSKEIRNPSLNFRRDEFAYTLDQDKTKRSLRLTAALSIILVFVFLTHMIILITSYKRDNNSIRDNIRKDYLSLFPNEKKIANELIQLKSHMKGLKDKENSFIGVSPLQTMLDLTKISRPDVAMTEITMDKDMVIIKGECPTLSDAQKMKNDLGEFLTEVNITDTRPSSQNRTLFTITAKGRKT